MNGTVAFDDLAYEVPRHVLSTKLAASLVALTVVVPTCLYLYHEYLDFKSLGPGGTPQNAVGFVKVFLLSFAKVSNPYELSAASPNTTHGAGFLHNLRPRLGPRPEVRGIAPHRQVTQRGHTATYELLVNKIERLGSSTDDLFIATSCFEKHSTGLFTLAPVHRTCAGEICHTHPSDGGSMHLTLPPADLKAVLEAGWGERHPLSRGGWFERFVPAGFVMVYAPRDEGEVEVVIEVVRAAGWYVRGGGIGASTEKGA